MSERDVEARLRDLKKRVEREPRSRFFVPLAEEYRKSGRLPEAIRALEDGLRAHPGYVAARVALARAFLETGRIEESMEAFSKVLVDDPSNLVAAKALGDIHLSRGQPMEALKRYLRFRAVSGDRRLDALIEKLRGETGASPEGALAPSPAPRAPAPPPPPPPVGPVATPTEPSALVNPLPPIDLWPAPPARRETDPFDITSVPFAPAPETKPSAAEPAEGMLSRDVPLGEPAREAPEAGGAVPRKLRLPEATWPFQPAIEAPPPSSLEGARALEVEATGRTLAELYLEQGHAGEAIGVVSELLAASPEDEGLRRLKRDAENVLDAPAPGQAPMPEADPGRERRLAKIRLLSQWLSAVQARSRP